ncbi:ABC transporter substrate-binding protein [Dyella sp. LX-66]|uniref:ABC transporter substrate-binding protein n=1 Tax=unclassified Dyella TaxID=2634549 RepID=UPI001BE00877|nr:MULTISPECIES: ABC transporter substrate-binding protein [unclassified Dyella]MBT2118914.1 ABC transporter substrate-binding protein [Dyella sp. LX-1]MBT2140092.1 ABC transporter substrate-binding protein [Dyella sp. LX-66]
MKRLIGRFGRAAEVSICAAGVALGLITMAAPTATASNATPAAGPVESFVWNLPTGEPVTLDPVKGGSPSGPSIVSNLCDKVLSINDDYSLAPGLAASQVVTPSKIVYTIRTDAAFWDGTPVTAEDVAFSLNRSAQPGQVYTDIFKNVSSIAVTAPNEVTITFSKPDELFAATMAGSAGVVLKKAFVEATGSAVGTPSGGLMCSGPFKFESWDVGESIVITRNDAYWNRAHLPLAKKVTFTFITDAPTYIQALKNGLIDGSYSVTPSAITDLEHASSGRLFFGSALASLQLYVSNPKGPMASIKLRDALQSIVDRDAVAKRVYKNHADAQYTVVSPYIWQDAARDIYAAAYPAFAQARAYDLKRSRTLVRQSGYAGQQLNLALATGEATTLRVAEMIRRKAKEVGVNVVIKQVSPAEYDQLFNDPAKRANPPMDLILGASGSGIKDPLQIIGFQYLPDGYWNLTGFNNPEVTRLINDSRESLDPRERAWMFVKMQDIYEKQSTMTPIVSQREITFLNNRLSGAVTTSAHVVMPAMVFVGASAQVKP